MNLSENTKRFFSILGLISCLYLLTYIQHLLDPQTWHYNMSMILTSCVSGLVWLWLFITALKFSNDLFDWNLERFAVCSCEDVEWMAGIPEDKDFPVLAKACASNGVTFTVLSRIDEFGNCFDLNDEVCSVVVGDIIAYIPLSHLTNENEK